MSKTIEIWEDRCNDGQCRSCHAAIVWTEVVESGRRMPFDKPLAVLAQRQDINRNILKVDLETSHFATCPQAKDWSRKNATKRPMRRPSARS